MGSEAGMVALAGKLDAWTFEDLQKYLPPTDVDYRRFEIDDGTLVVSPTAALRHEVICSRPRRALERGGLPAFEVLGQMMVDLHPSYRVPDVVVVTRELARTNVNLVPATEAKLVIEVVSPSSKTRDRVTKPAQYAADGIPVYLRVETEPDVTLTAYQLEPGATTYTELGTWSSGETVHLDRPFPVDIDIDSITP